MIGHGRFTIGGWGKVIHVTNLNDAGPGSLREAVGFNFPRIIVFDVSGMITLFSILYGSYPFCTIDARGANVCLRGAPFRIESPEWIVRNLRARPGDIFPDRTSADGITISSRVREVYNVYLENCSVSWAMDENVSVWGRFYSTRPHHITIVDCMVTEALNYTDPNDPADSNGYGVLFGYCDYISLLRSFVAYNKNRSTFVVNAAQVELANNIYGLWGGECIYLNETVCADVRGNWFKDNTDAVPALRFNSNAKGIVFLDDNGGMFSQDAPSEHIAFSNVPVASSGYEPMPADQAESYVLEMAGALPHDEADRRVIENYKAGAMAVPPTKWYPDSPEDVGVWNPGQYSKIARFKSFDADGNQVDIWERE